MVFEIQMYVRVANMNTNSRLKIRITKQISKELLSPKFKLNSDKAKLVLFNLTKTNKSSYKSEFHNATNLFILKYHFYCR